MPRNIEIETADGTLTVVPMAPEDVVECECDIVWLDDGRPAAVVDWQPVITEWICVQGDVEFDFEAPLTVTNLHIVNEWARAHDAFAEVSMVRPPVESIHDIRWLKGRPDDVDRIVAERRTLSE
jgi:hypothetical protein